MSPPLLVPFILIPAWPPNASRKSSMEITREMIDLVLIAHPEQSVELGVVGTCFFQRHQIRMYLTIVQRTTDLARQGCLAPWTASLDQLYSKYISRNVIEPVFCVRTKRLTHPHPHHRNYHCHQPPPLRWTGKDRASSAWQVRKQKRRPPRSSEGVE